MKKEIIILGLIFCCSIILGFYIRQFTLPMGFGDSEQYRAMAENPGKFVNPPWTYRIAVPYLAAGISYIFRLPIRTAFGVLQIIMFGLILTIIFYWIYKVFGKDRPIAFLPVLLFSFSYPGVYNLHNTAHVGFGEHLFVLLGCLAIYSNRWIALLFVIAFSSFVKESVGFLLIPTYFFSAVFFEPWRQVLLRTVVLIVSFVAPFLLLRSGLLFHSRADINTYTSFYTLDYVRYCWNYWGGPVGASQKIFAWFGPLILLSLAGLLVAPPRLKTMVILPILAVFQIFLATDVHRMIGVGVPVMIGLSSFALDRLRTSHAALIITLCILHFLFLNHEISKVAIVLIIIFIILVLFWMNRASLLGSINTTNLIAELAKRLKIHS